MDNERDWCSNNHEWCCKCGCAWKDAKTDNKGCPFLESRMNRKEIQQALEE